MSPDALTVNLLLSAAAVAVVHTAIGPDHTVPFVMLARARKWSLKRTLVVTGLCGVGHVGSSLLLGSLGVAAGVSTIALGGVEMKRGDIAAWAMVVFGCVYALWGVRQVLRRKKGYELHKHASDVHVHAGGTHDHSHSLLFRGHSHGHAQIDVQPQRSSTFWTLFLVFVLGPCEPLIPLFFLPASQGRWVLAAWTGVVFALATIATMVTLVGAACLGVRLLPLDRFDRWAHSLAGAVIAASGLAVLYGGL
jgi:nickel/cobalt transporter (NicO) family protein